MESDSAKSMSKESKFAMELLTRESAWCSIITGLAASGELSPETLGARGGLQRVRTLAVHVAGLAEEFHAAFLKQGASS